MKMYSNLIQQAAHEMQEKFSKMGNIVLPKGFKWDDTKGIEPRENYPHPFFYLLKRKL